MWGKMSLPVTWQAPETTFLAFSWKLKCRRRGSGRVPSTLCFTGSRVGSCHGRAGGQPGAGEDALAGMQPWELIEEREGGMPGWAESMVGSEEACQAGAVGEVGASLGAGLRSPLGAVPELRRVSRCKLLQPHPPTLLSSPAWLCAHAWSPKGRCEKTRGCLSLSLNLCASEHGDVLLG